MSQILAIPAISPAYPTPASTPENIDLAPVNPGVPSAISGPPAVSGLVPPPCLCVSAGESCWFLLESFADRQRHQIRFLPRWWGIRRCVV